MGQSSQCKLEDKKGVVNAPLITKSRMSRNSRSQLLTRGKKSTRRKHQEKFDVKHVKIADIKGAVELCIAASEALTISEIVKGNSASLPATAVIEAALRVKQARNQLFLDGLDNVSDCVTVEVDETDLLSDLDNYDMADAFEDVGLSLTQLDTICCSSSVKKLGCSPFKIPSRVLETPLSENHYGCDCEAHNVELRPQKVDLDSSSSQKKFEDAFAMGSKLSKDSVGCVPQKKLCSDPPLVLKSHFQQSFHKIPSSLEKPQDVQAFVDLKLKTTKSIPKFFNGETSFFSESADVVRDENSVAPKPVLESQIASFSSVAYEGLCATANDRIVVSQDMCSSVSLVDPLCSIVPCSISPNNADVTTTNQKSIEEEAAEHLNPQLWLENSHTSTRRLSFEFSHGKGDAVFKVNGEGSGATCHRRMTSLKTYSMLLPSRAASSKWGSDYCNASVPVAGTLDLLSSGEIVDCFKSSNRKDSTEFLISVTTSKRSAGRDYDKDHEIPVITKPILESPHQHKNCDDASILHHGTRSCFKACKVVYDSGVENVERTPIAEMTKTRNLIGFEDQRKIRSLSLFHSSQHLHAHEAQGTAKKRVRFSEAELKFQESKSGQQLQSIHQMRSITRTGKRLKESSLQSDLRCQEVNTCLTAWQIKDKKRMIFQGLEFLLTGFTSQKQTKLGVLIRKHGGFVLSDVPSPVRGVKRSRCKHQQLPIVLSSKKLQTTKFLYGCAVNALLLKVNWLTDSIVAGSVLPPQKYMIISNQDATKCSRIGWPVCCENKTWIFDRVGIMLYGKPSFCTKLAKVVKHGGGQLFKTLQCLVQGLKNENISLGAVVTEDEGRASRHLRHCASEQRLPVMPASWIINSLHLGQLLPFKEKHQSFPSPTTIKIPEFYMEFSEEI